MLATQRRGICSVNFDVLSVCEHIADVLGHGHDDEHGEWCAHRWMHVLSPGAAVWRAQLAESVKSRSDWPPIGTGVREQLERRLDAQVSIEGLEFLRWRALQFQDYYWKDHGMLSHMCVPMVNPLSPQRLCLDFSL